MPTLNTSHAIAVTTEGNYPFDLRFTSKLRVSSSNTSAAADVQADDVTGPGIYLVFFNGQALTVGTLPAAGRTNIFESRWLRLLNRVTLRGVQTGLGRLPALETATDEQKFLAKLHQVLPERLLPYVEHLFAYEREDKPFKDTGAVATRLDLEFAAKHWSSFFAEATESTILEPFEFFYYQLFDCVDCSYADALKALEKALIDSYALPLNAQPQQDFEALSIEQQKQGEVEAFMETVLKQSGIRCQLRLALSLVNQ